MDPLALFFLGVIAFTQVVTLIWALWLSSSLRPLFDHFGDRTNAYEEIGRYQPPEFTAADLTEAQTLYRDTLARNQAQLTSLAEQLATVKSAKPDIDTIRLEVLERAITEITEQVVWMETVGEPRDERSAGAFLHGPFGEGRMPRIRRRMKRAVVAAVA